MAVKYYEDLKLYGPGIKPNIKPGDYHIVVNDEVEKMKIYDHTGKLLKTLPALAKGWNGPTSWRNGGDTPPGLYLLGQFFPWHKGESQDILETYGPICFDLVEQENQENERGRSGICIHGGRSQKVLQKTSGCIRVFNQDLEEHVLPLGYKWSESHRCWVKKPNKVWISVFQDKISEE